MDRNRFRRLVQRALDDLPPEVARHLDNVEMVIRREPSTADLDDSGGGSGDGLFGLYLGVPQTERESYGMTLPDRIAIYQGPLERAFHPRDIPREIRITVAHEIGHHFGIDDDRLHELGLA
jgi:predicted Zn-dependent protease with MMP-like domain